MINNDENDAKEPKGERKAYYDEDQSPCLSLPARTQSRERERGQEGSSLKLRMPKSQGNYAAYGQ